MPHSWLSLPAELRLAILEDLANDCNENNLKHIQPVCATICGEWQAFFERETFRKVVLHASCLETFKQLIDRRQAFPPIKHIWLRVELGVYNCESCKTRESSEETEKNNIIFTNTIWELLTILSRVRHFDIRGKEDNNIIFEFSASSPSDGHHMFKNSYRLHDNYPFSANIDYQAKFLKDKLTKNRTRVNDEFHGFKNGRSLARPRQLNMGWIQQAQRLIQPLSFDFQDLGLHYQKEAPVHLPRVDFVTAFVIRRQHHRDISPATLGQLFEQSFPSLQTIRHERWRLITNNDRKKDDYNYGMIKGGLACPDNLLCYKLPHNLTRLHIFEDFEPAKNGINVGSRPRYSRIKILRSLEPIAATLEHISVSYLTDAWICFTVKDYTYQPQFPNLKSIALTSQQYLRRDQSTSKINILLLKAAIIVNKMPKLEIMEIWNTECFFRYDRTSTRETHRLTYGSTWAEQDIFEVETLQAWRLVDPSRELKHNWERLPYGRIPNSPSHGTIMRHLKLREMILDPISLLQVRCEAGDFGKRGAVAYRPK